MAVLAHALAALVLVDLGLTSLLKRSHNDLCVVCGFLDWENGRLPLWANGEICNYLLTEKSSRKRILRRILLQLSKSSPRNTPVCTTIAA